MRIGTVIGMTTRRAVCPGSFDPVTNGHLDVFARAAKQFDEVTVAVFINSSKVSLFSVEERMELLREATAHIPNITISSFTGLVVEFCKKHNIPVIVRGLRALAQPGHPDADAEGFVRMPNVQLPIEMVNLLTASRAYEANLRTAQTFRQINEQALALLRG